MAETQLDSVSQKLHREKHPEAKKVFRVLVIIRTLQANFFPVKSHSLLRYSNCKIGPGGKILPPLDKKNWRKYRKLHPPKSQRLLNKPGGEEK